MGIIEKLERTNNMVCPWWLCYSFDNPLRRIFHKPEPLLAPYVKPGMTAVDIGCGMGYFTLGLAKLAGSEGRVIAVDLQRQMLDALERRARRAGVADRIILHRCRPDSLGVEGPVDFALVFWMAHEVPDKPRFFREIFALLKTGGRLLLAEPKFHVTLKSLERTLAICREAGFRALEEPAIALSRAVLMGKE
ncbi:MAG: class I SAM-dependent methyltransferase [Deltaproteobacteria bacterium]|nr:MAG: class I SAM-dependent methyltransferase [Deltaproteobacteria bacterium]